MHLLFSPSFKKGYTNSLSECKPMSPFWKMLTGPSNCVWHDMTDISGERKEWSTLCHWMWRQRQFWGEGDWNVAPLMCCHVGVGNKRKRTGLDPIRRLRQNTAGSAQWGSIKIKQIACKWQAGGETSPKSTNIKTDANMRKTLVGRTLCDTMNWWRQRGKHMEGQQDEDESNQGRHRNWRLPRRTGDQKPNETKNTTVRHRIK